MYFIVCNGVDDREREREMMTRRVVDYCDDLENLEVNLFFLELLHLQCKL